MTEQSIVLPGTNPQPQGQAHEASPLEFVHRLHRILRGRYLLAAVLTSIGAAAGGLLGWFITKPEYAAEGAIRIRTTVNRRVFDVAENRQINPLNVAKTQAAFLRDPRVIEKAFTSPEWLALGRPRDEAAKDRFADAMRVVVDREEAEWVRLSFYDRDRKASETAVSALLNAYRDIAGATESIADPKLIEDLNSRIGILQRELRSYETQEQTIARNFGTTNLDKLKKDTEDRFGQLDEIARSLEQQITLAEVQLKAQAEGGVNIEPDRGEDAELVAQAGEVSKTDPLVGQLLMSYTTIARDYRARVERLSPNHRSVQQLRSELEEVTTQLRDAVRDARARKIGENNLGFVDLTQGIRTAEDLAKAKKLLEDQQRARAEAQDRLFKIDDQLAQIRGLRAEQKRIGELVADISRRRDQLSMELRGDESASRIEIMPKVDSPFRPKVDNRKKFAALGMGLGGGLPLAFVLALGLLDRRVRYSDDAQDSKSQLTLLGVLPYLPNDLQDPEQASIAAHCVHQIRTLLQIGGADHSRRTFAVTSPTSGDGKTSLAMSLGLSFAASGARTLLVDFDLVGGGLTSAMGVKAKHGLLDAVVNGELNGYVRDTNFPRLTILPAGLDDARDVSSLSLQLVRNLIAQAKQQYDAVIIDTGPILGSLEASLVCAAADGAILTLGRGQQRLQAERAMEHLAGIGATFLGVVFNRAEANDFKKAVSSASVRSRPLSDEERAARPVGGLMLPQMGPVARTVASHIRSPQPSSNGFKLAAGEGAEPPAQAPAQSFGKPVAADDPTRF